MLKAVGNWRQLRKPNGQVVWADLNADDTPGESRIEAASTEYQSTLQLGHLKQQSDNARQADRGHGGELTSQAAAALRAGNGLLLSADARPGASGHHLDSREPISQTEAAQSLSHSLADVAGKQNAALKGDPAADQLPAVDALKHAGEVMSATASRSAASASEGDIKSTQGGSGSVPFVELVVQLSVVSRWNANSRRAQCSLVSWVILSGVIRRGFFIPATAAKAVVRAIGRRWRAARAVGCRCG